MGREDFEIWGWKALVTGACVRNPGTCGVVGDLVFTAGLTIAGGNCRPRWAGPARPGPARRTVVVWVLASCWFGSLEGDISLRLVLYVPCCGW